MKQIGNLAIVCAQRPDVLMQIYGGTVSIHVGEGPERATLSAAWEDDDTIQDMIRELNFGRYTAHPRKKEEGRRCSMIKNLNQLKRRLRPGTRLEVTGHCRPGCIGQLREVTWVNTQGVYTKILNPPDPRINAANDGRGSIMWWGAASTWSFEDGVCSSYMNQTKTAETLIMAFRVLDGEAA